MQLWHLKSLSTEVREEPVVFTLGGGNDGYDSSETYDEQDKPQGNILNKLLKVVRRSKLKIFRTRTNVLAVCLES